MQLTDFDADQRLLALPGSSLLVFTGDGCSSCRYARQTLPEMELPIDRVCWIDAADNGGLVERYEVFHLPALFVVRDGMFHGALHARLSQVELAKAIVQVLQQFADELP